VVAYWSSSKNIGKMNSQPMNLPWAHMLLEFDVLGVTRMLVIYVVHSFKRENQKEHISRCPK
jgi:hypothetical protein